VFVPRNIGDGACSTWSYATLTTVRQTHEGGKSIIPERSSNARMGRAFYISYCGSGATEGRLPASVRRHRRALGIRAGGSRRGNSHVALKIDEGPNHRHRRAKGHINKKDVLSCLCRRPHKSFVVHRRMIERETEPGIEDGRTVEVIEAPERSPARRRAGVRGAPRRPPE